VFGELIKTNLLDICSEVFIVDI